MKIIIVNPFKIYDGEVPIGSLYISSALKKAGFEVYNFFPDLSKIVNFKSLKYHFLIKEFHKILEIKKPEIIAFSALSTNFEICLKLAQYAKKMSDTNIIFGGVHSIIDYDNIIKNNYVDAVCVGEGEVSLPEYLKRLSLKKLSENNDLNITYKINGNVINAFDNYSFPELDTYHFPDRDCLKSYYEKNILTSANFITGRGCPYQCHYCNAVTLNKNKKYLRFRSIENIIEEILEVKKKYNIEKVIFSDETFTLNKKRLFLFLEEYRKKINFPFVCQTRVETIDNEIAKELKKSDCVQVTLGIESGNPDIRKNFLNRKMSDEQIIEAFQILKKNGLYTSSFNMIGLPEETENKIWEAIYLNRKSGVSKTHCTIFMPFKGTKIYEWYAENNLIVKEPSINYYNDIIIKHPSLSNNLLKYYSMNFDYLVNSNIDNKSMKLKINKLKFFIGNYLSFIKIIKGKIKKIIKILKK